MNFNKLLVLLISMTFPVLASAIDNSKACVLDQYHQMIDTLYSDDINESSIDNLSFQRFLTFEYRCQLSKGRTETEIFVKLDEHIDQFNKEFVTFTGDNTTISKQQMHIFTSESVNAIARNISPNRDKTCGNPEYQALGKEMDVFGEHMPSRESFERFLELDVKCSLDSGLTAEEMEARLSDWTGHYNMLLKAHNTDTSLFSKERFILFAVSLVPVMLPQAQRFVNPAHKQLIDKFTPLIDKFTP